MKQTLKPSVALLGYTGVLTGVGLVLGIANDRLPPVAADLYWAVMLALTGFALVDAIRLARQPSPRLRRQLPGSLALGRWSEVRLDIEPLAKSGQTIVLFDHPPPELEFEHLPQTLTLEPHSSAQIGYRLRPVRRGPLALRQCEIQLRSPLGLWWSRRYLALTDVVRVYPDFARLHNGQLLAVDNLLGQIGIRQHPRRGTGLEFHQLREFRDGDSLRQIDWKATARQRMPIAREYQDERDQQIVFLLDCGRQMRSQDDDLSHFDHALNACLLLSYVALRQGDAVGFSTFAAEVDRHHTPVKGQAQLHRLLNATYDLEPTHRPADYASAVRQLMARQHKRALIVLVTNLRDEEDQELLDATKRLGQHHRVLVASLREEMFDRVRHDNVQTYADALTYCGVLELLNARDHLQERLVAQGVPVLDARPAELGPRLITRYLDWKKAGTL